jgi:hypothetical protein
VSEARECDLVESEEAGVSAMQLGKTVGNEVGEGLIGPGPHRPWCTWA